MHSAIISYIALFSTDLFKNKMLGRIHFISPGLSMRLACSQPLEKCLQKHLIITTKSSRGIIPLFTRILFPLGFFRVGRVKQSKQTIHTNNWCSVWAFHWFSQLGIRLPQLEAGWTSYFSVPNFKTQKADNDIFMDRNQILFIFILLVSSYGIWVQ